MQVADNQDEKEYVLLNRVSDRTVIVKDSTDSENGFVKVETGEERTLEELEELKEMQERLAEGVDHSCGTLLHMDNAKLKNGQEILQPVLADLASKDSQQSVGANFKAIHDQIVPSVTYKEQISEEKHIIPGKKMDTSTTIPSNIETEVNYDQSSPQIPFLVEATSKVAESVDASFVSQHATSDMSPFNSPEAFNTAAPLDDEIKRLAEVDIYVHDAIEYVSNQEPDLVSGFVIEEDMLESAGKNESLHRLPLFSTEATSQMVKTNEVKKLKSLIISIFLLFSP